MKTKFEKLKLYGGRTVIFISSALFSCFCLFICLPVTAQESTSKQMLKQVEVIKVIGKKHNNGNYAALNSDMIFIDETAKTFQSVSDLVSDIPGVDLSGQGGLFQVFSIRGLSGARVQTQISGIPILSERRAGTSASFIAVSKSIISKSLCFEIFGSTASTSKP